jgi:hypothetical protein
MKKLLLFALMVMVYCSGGSNVLKAQINWEAANGPHGGAIRDMVITPAGEIFVVTTLILPVYPFNTGKIYRSTNEGATWSEVSFAGNPIGLSINQSGDLIAADNDTRLYRSTNNGSTWSMAADLDYGVSSLEGRNGKLGAGTSLISNDHGQTVARGSFYLSTNNGASWSAKITNLAIIKSHITASGTLFVNLSTSTPVSYQVRRSTNDGASWDVLSLPAGSSGHSSVSSTQSGKVFIVSSGGIYSSTDNGNTWTPSFTGGGCNFLQTDNSGNIFALNYSIVNGNVNYTLIKSSNEGAGWTNVASLPPFTVREFGFPVNGKMFAATSMGFFISSNSGAAWEMRNTGLNTNPVSALGFNSGRLFAATGSGNYFSDNDGATWSLLNTIGTVTGIENIVTASGNVFFKNYKSIYRSSDNGSTWSTVWHDSLPDINTDLVATTNGVLMFGGTGADIYRSTDGGLSWQVAYDSLTFASGISTIAPGLNGEVYTGISDGQGSRLLRSTNNGSNWSTVFTDPSFMIQFRNIKVTSSGVIINYFTNIHRSTDNGATWESIQGIPMGSIANSNMVENSDGELFVNSNNGIFMSSNSGANWNTENTWLTNLAVNCVELNSSQRLFAGTSTGVFRTATATGIIGAPVVNSYSLSQNYPNPFNPITVINYGLRNAGYVSIKVYDMSGKLVKELVNGRKEAGTYAVTFDGSALPSGAYFYKLETGGYSEVRKMMLIK